MGTIQGATKEALLLPVGKVSNELPCVGRAGDTPVPDPIKPFAKLKSGGDPAGLGLT
jgi:hypothetical protein